MGGGRQPWRSAGAGSQPLNLRDPKTAHLWNTALAPQAHLGHAMQASPRLFPTNFSTFFLTFINSTRFCSFSQFLLDSIIQFMYTRI